MMETFDYPEMGPNCVARSVSVISPQSLLLLNNDHIHELATSLAQRVQHLTDGDKSENQSAGQVDCVYRLALNRDPNASERRLGVAALQELTSDWHGAADGPLITYCHTILNSAAFVYID